jgi:hypothetical protein
MSEPVTNAEVEDVLSSIRRLVGETKRPNHVRIHDGAGEEAQDMLVLTPQLRVEAGDEVLKLMPEDAVSSATEWYEFEEPPLPEKMKMVPDRQVEPEAFEDEHPAPAEPEYEKIEVKRTSKAEFLDLSAKIAALETAIAKTVDQWEPDGTDSDAYSGTQPPAMTWQDNVELDGLGKPVSKPVEFAHSHAPAVQSEPVQDAENALETALDEQIIDEETLRAMVADIVRSELQGELGERITRNVRKLVRREIHRALVAQSLD